MFNASKFFEDIAIFVIELSSGGHFMVRPNGLDSTSPVLRQRIYLKSIDEVIVYSTSKISRFYLQIQIPIILFLAELYTSDWRRVQFNRFTILEMNFNIPTRIVCFMASNTKCQGFTNTIYSMDIFDWRMSFKYCIDFI